MATMTRDLTALEDTEPRTLLGLERLT